MARWPSCLLPVVLAATLAVAAAAEKEKEKEPGLNLHGVSEGISITVFAGILVTMAALYGLTSKPDRKTSGSDEPTAAAGHNAAAAVVGETIAIFVAVLVFGAANGVVEHLFFLDDAVNESIIDMVQFLCWFVLVEVVIAHVTNTYRLHAEGEHKYDDAESLLKAISLCGAEFIAFSANNAFGTVQYRLCLHITSEHPLWQKIVGVAVMMAATGFLAVLHHFVAPLVRKWLKEEDDKGEEIYLEFVQETEEDAIPVTCSFLLSQCIRFLLTDNLPDAQGKEDFRTVMQKGNRNNAAFALLIVGAFFLACAVFTKWGSMPRFIVKTLANTSAWCAFFAALWLVPSILRFGDPRDDVRLHIVVALVITVCTIVPFFFLRSARDNGKVFSSLFDALSLAIPILVGFAWEQTFDYAFENISELIDSTWASFWMLGLALFLSALILPVWASQIVPMMREDGGDVGGDGTASQSLKNNETIRLLKQQLKQLEAEEKELEHRVETDVLQPVHYIVTFN